VLHVVFIVGKDFHNSNIFLVYMFVLCGQFIYIL